jgi:hypothetical protein
MLIGGRSLITISAACAEPIPTAIPMSVVKSSFRIVFSCGYMSKCMAVTDFPYSTKERTYHMSEAADFKTWAIEEVTM